MSTDSKHPEYKRLGFFTRVLDPVSAAERYRIALDHIVYAEELGYSSAWVAQHHFHEQEGGLPSPFVLLAAAAAKTTSIRLGTGVITLPLENAIRVAEDAAVLDLISGGRLELGLGSGGTPSSFPPFGLLSENRADVYAQNVETLRRAFAEQPVHGDSVVYPVSPGLGDRVWQATFSVGGGIRAGKAGDGLMLSRVQPSTPETAHLSLAEEQNLIIDAYLDSLPTGVEPRISGARGVFVADDPIEARRITLEAMKSSPILMRMFPQGLDDDALLHEMAMFVGTPDEITEIFAADSALARCTDITFQIHPAEPHESLVARSLELLMTEVAPALGWVPEKVTA